MVRERAAQEVPVPHEVISRPAAAQHLRDLAWLRRVRDRIDREYAEPLDVEALARGAHMSAGHCYASPRRPACAVGPDHGTAHLQRPS